MPPQQRVFPKASPIRGWMILVGVALLAAGCVPEVADESLGGQTVGGTWSIAASTGQTINSGAAATVLSGQIHFIGGSNSANAVTREAGRRESRVMVYQPFL